VEDEKSTESDEHESDDVVPVDRFSEVPDRENCKYGEGDDFLNGFQFHGTEIAMPDAVGGNLEAIFKQSNAPAHKDHSQKRFAFELQMTVPCKGHKYVGKNQQSNGGKGDLDGAHKGSVFSCGG